MKKIKRILYINSLILALLLSLPIFTFTTGQGLEVEAEEQYDDVQVFYYREGENARESLFTNYESIDILAPQSYAFDEKGSLKGSVSKEVLDFTKKKNMKVMPLVTNGSFGQKSLVAVLNNPTIQKKAIKQMVDEARKNNFIGWQIDFEQMNVEYKDKFTLFVKKASEALHKKNLILSVAVIAKFSDIPSDYKNTLWTDLIGVYDYKKIGEYSDFVSIMSYDAPDSKGAISPYPWLVKVLEYSLKYIPKEKLSLGIPLYYWKWDDVRGKITGIGGFEGLKIALGSYNPKLGYDNVVKAPYLKYVRNKVANTIWYENEVSIKEKMLLLEKYKLHGFSAWALGLELPATHLVFRE